MGKFFIKFALLPAVLLFTSISASAQEYKYEIGGQAGGTMYMGDANQADLMIGWKPTLGLVFRKNIDFRWAMKADLGYGRIGGDTNNTDNAFPNDAQVAFTRNFFRLGGQVEFNFMPYSDKFAYLHTSRLSPYLLAGLAITVAPGNDNTFVGLAYPLGIGVKYKIVNRINLGLEFAINNLLGDSFDAPKRKNTFHLDNPYNIQSGIFKNRDRYNSVTFSVTWDFGPNDRKCTNL